MRLRAFGRVALASLALAFGFALAAQQPTRQLPVFAGQNSALPVIHIDHGPNSPHAQSQHYVVLVSLDGFRRDYAKRDGGGAGK
jgi:hypothetical protein